jgi:hypothetical protein
VICGNESPFGCGVCPEVGFCSELVCAPQPKAKLVVMVRTIQQVVLVTFRRKNNAPHRGDFASRAVHFLHDRT